MPRQYNGVQSTIAAARVVIRMYNRFGVRGMLAELGPEVMAAVAALEIAIRLFESLDDQPGKIDHSPGGWGDTAL